MQTNLIYIHKFSRCNLDSTLFSNISDFHENVPVSSIVGDITNINDVRSALNGVQAVIHTASLISVGPIPDVQALHNVNVKGETETCHL